MNRGFWFVAGAGAGVYAMVRARRAAEAFTPEGFRDRLSALQLGAGLFAEEVRIGMAEKETELRDRIGLTLDGPDRPRLLAAVVSTSSTDENTDHLPDHLEDNA